MAKSTLFISDKLPYGSSCAHDLIELALGCAIVDAPVSLLFEGDGVYQLLNGQATDSIQQKNLNKNLAALGLFGVDDVFVSESCLELRGLQAKDLSIEIRLIKAAEVNRLVHQHDVCIRL